MGNRWREEGGYREVLRLAVPLILSTGSWSIQHFVDRVFLSWYSRDALAAALPAGMLNFTFASFFIGTVSYVNTFVAQYTGAGRPHRVGPAVWQGIYMGLAAGVLILGLIPFADRFFEWAGHDPEIRALEAAYFRIFCLMGPSIAGVAMSSFFSGRGDTGTVMWVNVAATAVNIALDYAWIFGRWGFPEWGIRGAAWATVAAHLFMTLLFFGLMLRRRFREAYCTLSGWRPEGELFSRLVRFGVPNGIQFMLEIMGFSIFILLVGKLGAVPLAATNITFNINTLAFVPMLGMGIAVSTLVGQYLGQERPELAERSTWSAAYLAVGYMLAMATGYVAVPGLFLLPYTSGADPEAFAQIWGLCVVLLRFVALYCVFDALYIIFSAAVKGAGDTRFVMYMSVALAWSLMVVPTYLSISVFGWGLYVAWIFISLYIVAGGVTFLLRFRGGKWKSMRVIEPAPVLPAAGPAEGRADRKREAVEAERELLEKENRLVERQERLLEGEKDMLWQEILKLGVEPVPESEIDVIDAVEGRIEPAEGEQAETGEDAEEAVFEASDEEGEWLAQPEEDRFRVLLVDDNDDLRKVLFKGLVKVYDVDIAADGLEALTKILKEKQEYDLVITDLKMPNVDGFMLMEHLPRDLPVVVISGFLQAPEFQEAIERFNLVAALEKPFRFAEVRKVIEEVARQKGLEGSGFGLAEEEAGGEENEGAEGGRGADGKGRDANRAGE